MAYNIREFIRREKSMTLGEILKAAREEGRRAEQTASGRGTREARDAGSLDYARKLGRLLFILQYERLPDGLSSENDLFREEYEAYHELIIDLVERGELEPAWLSLFPE